MQVIPYSDSLHNEWDRLVRESRNATFLLERSYMDYHKDRFSDCSLLFVKDSGKVLGGMPANFKEQEKVVESHGGLTYGGLLLSEDAHLCDVRDMLRICAEHYLQLGAHFLEYKPIPYFYHRYPSCDDLYWLFRADAKLSARAVSSVIDLQAPLHFSTLRRRKVKNAMSQWLACVQESDEVSWSRFWQILTETLETCHHTVPVHSVEEMLLLHRRFPDSIRLHLVKEGTSVLGGCVVYSCPPVAHVQYIAANRMGKEKCALDFLFCHLIHQYKETHRYFDFGISTERRGTFLNEGLVFQKEGFGGRAACYDSYCVNLEKLVGL